MTLINVEININAVGITESMSFKNKIANTIPTYLMVASIQVDEIGIKRATGYGQYKLFFKGYINGEPVYFTRHCTDSPLWDWFADAEGEKLSDYKKHLLISLLEEYFETL